MSHWSIKSNFFFSSLLTRKSTQAGSVRNLNNHLLDVEAQFNTIHSTFTKVSADVSLVALLPFSVTNEVKAGIHTKITNTIKAE